MKFIEKNGKKVCLLTPSERGNKYAKELRIGSKFTNAGELKTDDFANPIRLNEEDKAFRYGYLNARKDNANAYKAALKKGNQ